MTRPMEQDVEEFLLELLASRLAPKRQVNLYRTELMHWVSVFRATVSLAAQSTLPNEPPVETLDLSPATSPVGDPLVPISVGRVISPPLVVDVEDPKPFSVEEMTPELIDQALRSIGWRRFPRQVRERTLAPLEVFCRWLVRKGRIANNPLVSLQAGARRRPKTRRLRATG